MPMLHTFKPSRAPVKRVKGVQFCVWDPEDIVCRSSATFCLLAWRGIPCSVCLYLSSKKTTDFWYLFYKIVPPDVLECSSV
jgi:hypothetical protein